MKHPGGQCSHRIVPLLRAAEAGSATPPSILWAAHKLGKTRGEASAAWAQLVRGVRRLKRQWTPDGYLP